MASTSTSSTPTGTVHDPDETPGLSACIARSDTARCESFPQFCVLACLEEFGGGSQREISDRLRFDPSDLVEFVDGLEEAGFVRRR
jgi:DNA-binding MarR family transcriptional regulator